ncbi:pimeloyl-ACP methyl ester carboxylesterase [Micromonospora kangleipakensis]|uniref:Pimeloyl-ACP methyl ester carboxylesterase n=1 Tax=Micromonospora kangleipakensis TaxID=1077942 RepID=A0A4Q8B5L4_9ACTN|nr:epoxide hydrolase family protein [Micromonospora kangleipakensis]RZU72880.1 pimeloyl-ACP methyl ester carboxylesterase [Micromonospora kangleipakensis]
MTFTPFRIDVSDEVLDDLRARVARTRFTDRSGDRPWQGGADPDYLRDLVSYWADGFDWRAREAELNALPHYRAKIGGRRLHFVRVAGKRPAGAPAPLPLILSHGWPSSFVEMLPLVDRLTDPARYGGDPAEAFDVVVPSLPGFLWSELPEGPLTRAAMARTLHLLMTDILGHHRYGAFGGDVGGVVTGWLGALYPEQVAGIHMIHPPFPASFDAHPLSPAEQAYLDAEVAYDRTDGGYSAIMGTRPDTIAAALIDSPVGLAAWLVDKYRDWSDNHGELESRFDRDTLLTIITLYWASGSIGSSFRQYFDFDHNSPRPDITVPAAFTVSTEPSQANFPRQIAERACTDIRHWSEPGRGGHFMPLEEPDLLAGELTRFFTSLHRP